MKGVMNFIRDEIILVCLVSTTDQHAFWSVEVNPKEATATMYMVCGDTGTNVKQ